MHLNLKPAQHLFTEDATIQVNGKTEPLSAVGLYTGKIDQLETFNHVHLKIEADGTVQGIIVDGGDAYHIDPVADHFDSPQDFDHVVYREADMVFIKPTHKVDRTLAHSSPRDRRQLLEEGDDDDPTAKVRADKYQKDYNTCHMALWADKSFVDQFGGSNEAVVKMLQRFSITQEVYATTDITLKLPSTGQSHTLRPKLKIQNLIVDGQANMAKYTTATSYLEAFSERADGSSPETVRDWSRVCLAHAFTNQDYDGTLGLAWTAYPDSANHNGGICQSQYRDGKGKDVSLNTGFSTSLNFGSQQPELQTTLVFVHEVGHNFGSPHDFLPSESGYTAPGSGGVNVMYPYAPSGAAENNDEFSVKSAGHIGQSMRDRAGCFLNDDGEAGTCGNFIADGTDECDCGGTVSSCSAFDPNESCDSECKLNPKCSCNPLDSDNGLCCSSTDDDNFCQKIEAVCHTLDNCMAPVSCDDGVCADPEPRQENALCQDGVAQCTATSGCAGLCDTEGSCSKSICSLFGREDCASNFGQANGCSIKCARLDENDEACDSVAELADAAEAGTLDGVVSWDKETRQEVAFTDFTSLSQKAPGSKCANREGEPDSGICDTNAQCLRGDMAEDALAELYAQYNYLKNTFVDWANDDTSGIPNYGWFIIGAFLILFLCMGLCWRCNKEHVVEAKNKVTRRMSRQG
jgi:hypothetical protein